jgi:hypothetical protein
MQKIFTTSFCLKIWLTLLKKSCFATGIAHNLKTLDSSSYRSQRSFCHDQTGTGFITEAQAWEDPSVPSIMIIIYSKCHHIAIFFDKSSDASLVESFYWCFLHLDLWVAMKLTLQS